MLENSHLEVRTTVPADSRRRRLLHEVVTVHEGDRCHTDVTDCVTLGITEGHWVI